MSKQVAFWGVFASILVLTTLVGLELVCAVVAPAWPAYLLRPTMLPSASARPAGEFMPEVNFQVNSWHTRDLERTSARPRALFDQRAVFVGDSFLEGGFTRAPLPLRIEGMLLDRNVHRIETVNLGISGTDLEEYYYRTRDVALKIEPDLVLLSVYSGNDFTLTPFQPGAARPFVAPLPRPSLLGSVMPHTAWIARNLKRPSSAAEDQKLIDRIVEMPPEQRLDQLTQVALKYYVPTVKPEVVKEILARGEDRFWAQVSPRRFDREFLPNWIIKDLINWELDPSTVPFRGSDDAMAGASSSWIEATQRLVVQAKAGFVVILVPVGLVDPEYAAYWRPWPSFLAFNATADARHQLLARALAEKNIPLIDLRPVLSGIAGTYRKLDGHWTEKGHEIVARFLTDEVLWLTKARASEPQRAAAPL